MQSDSGAAEGPHEAPSLQRLALNFECLTREFELMSARETSAATFARRQRFLDAAPANFSATPRAGSQEESPTWMSAHSSRQQPDASPLSFASRETSNVPTTPAVASETNAAARADEIALRRVPEPQPCVTPRVRTRAGRIRVVVRKRPMVQNDAWTDCVTVNPPNVHVAVKKLRVDLTDYEDINDFVFDDAFSEEKKNVHIFESCGKELIATALSGGSASCFAYGQTGSGKTHTMLGSEEEKGLYILAATELFARLPPSFEVHASLYEIYCNSLFDLLNDRAPVVVREDHNHRVNICGLSWHKVDSADALWSLISSGADQRSTGSTTANERSSRSHAVLTIRLRRCNDAFFLGTLNFVDLAGSERANDTAMSDRQTRQEGADINKSLLALKECIRALDERKKHVPFRGSKLTEILRDSFVGNSHTVMIANISASSCNCEHTVNTLRYAFRVKGLSVASIEPSKARNAPRPVKQPNIDVPPPRNYNDTQAVVSSARTTRAPSSTAKLQHADNTRRATVFTRLSYPIRATSIQNNVNQNHNYNNHNSNGNGNSEGNVENNSDRVAVVPRAMMREKVLRAPPVLDAQEPRRETVADTRGGVERKVAAASVEECQKKARLVECAVQQMQHDIKCEVEKAVQKRDCLIKKLQNENATLRELVALLKRRAEGCPLCGNQGVSASENDSV